MFKKSLTVAVAVLSLTGASLTTTSSAQAGSLGKFVAASILGTAVGAIAIGSARARENHSEYRAMRGGYDDECGYRKISVFDEYGNRIGSRRVPAC